MRKRNEVTARNFIDLSSEPLPGHGGLKLTREKPVVSPDDDVDRSVGPSFEICGLLEGNFRFLTLVLSSLFGDILWHVVKEISGEIELGPVALALGRCVARLEPSRVIPPISGSFTGKRDHRIHKDQHANPIPGTGTYNRCREGAH